MFTVALIAVAAAACRSESALSKLAHARELSADLSVQFITAVDASNKAIMAETDQGTAGFVADTERARHGVSAQVAALGPLFQELRYDDEGALLRTFAERFEEYQVMDRQILSLTVENTNRKAQRLAFGPAQQEAESFRQALAPLARATGAGEWRVKALAATAIAAVSEIQVLESPHIAEPGDAVMTGIETKMAASESTARDALQSLTAQVGTSSRAQLAAANAALDRFMAIHAQLLALSRRNTNVRSLALSLNEKGKLTGACEASLGALREALAARGASATR
jgi:hypothetical protein